MSEGPGVTHAATLEGLLVETKGLLFDMDGVLVSSIGSVNRCWRRWCEMYSVPGAETFVIPHGTRAVDIIRMLKPEFDEVQVQAGLLAIEDLEIDDVADLQVLPGVKALLESLPRERWAIVTSATWRLLIGRLEAAGLPVPERIISGDMVERGKPDPEPYRRGADLLGLTPEECVVVEDAPSGVGAGVAAGSRVLGVLGTHPVEQLGAATWVLGSLEGLAMGVVEMGWSCGLHRWRGEDSVSPPALCGQCRRGASCIEERYEGMGAGVAGDAGWIGDGARSDSGV